MPQSFVVHCSDCLNTWQATAAEEYSCPNCDGTAVWLGGGPGPDGPTGVVGAAVRRALVGG